MSFYRIVMACLGLTIMAIGCNTPATLSSGSSTSTSSNTNNTASSPSSNSNTSSSNTSSGNSNHSSANTNSVAIPMVYVFGAASSQIVTQVDTDNFASGFLSVNSNCANVNVTIYGAGLGNIPIATSTTTSTGNFNVAWSSNEVNGDLLIEVSCPSNFSNELWCYADANSSSTLCDPVSTAIALTIKQMTPNHSIVSDSNFIGLHISDRVQSLATSIRLQSSIDPTDPTLGMLANTNAFATVLDNLSVNNRFVMGVTPIHSILTQTYNYSANWLKNPNYLAFFTNQSNLLTPRAVLDWFVGMGMRVVLTDTFDANSSSALYGGLGPVLDATFNTNFFMPMKSYLASLPDFYDANAILTTPSSLVDSSNVLTPAAPLGQLYCLAQDLDSGNNYSYWPEKMVAINGNQLGCNGNQPTLLGIQNANVRYTLNYGALPAEPSRNTMSNFPSQTKPASNTIGLIELFPEFIEQLGSGNCNDLATAANVFSDTADFNQTNFGLLGNCLASQGNIGNLYAGVYWAYQQKFNVNATQYSLSDVYQALVHHHWARLGYGTQNYQQTLNIPLSNTNALLTSWTLPLIEQANLLLESNQYVSRACNAPLCNANGSYVSSLNANAVATLLSESVPSYDVVINSLTPYLNSASFTTMLATHGYHVDSNPSGQANFAIMGYNSNGTVYPVLCEASNPNSLFNGNTMLMDLTIPPGTGFACMVDTNTLSNAPSTNLSAGVYTQKFGLSYAMQANASTYFNLVSLYNGQPLSYENGLFFIRDIGFEPSSVTDSFGIPVVADGNTVHTAFSTMCPSNYGGSLSSLSNDCNTIVTNYVALDFNRTVNSNSLYTLNFNVPYWSFVEVGSINANHQSTMVPMQVAMANTTSGMMPLCFGGNVETLSSLAANQLVSVQDMVPFLADCRTMLPPYYYLTLDSTLNGNVTDPNNPYYSVTRFDGVPMYNANCTNPNAANFYCRYVFNYQFLANNSSSYGLGYSFYQAGASVPKFDVWMAQNVGYSQQSDPFCLDIDRDGVCDCVRQLEDGNTMHLTATSSPNAWSCTLQDSLGVDLTLPQAPTVFGTESATWLQQVLQNCAGNSNTALSSCLNANAYFSNSNALNHLQGTTQWNMLALCANSLRYPMGYVSYAAMLDNPNVAGPGCGNWNMTTMAYDNGAVTLFNYLPRVNAYSVSQPQTALALFGTLKNGLGSNSNLMSVDANAQILSFEQAMAFASLRMMLPVWPLGIEGPSLQTSLDANDYMPPWTIDAFASPTMSSAAYLGGSVLGISSALVRQSNGL